MKKKIIFLFENKKKLVVEVFSKKTILISKLKKYDIKIKI